MLLTFFCYLYSFSQIFKGVIKNAETNQPISQITIISEDDTFFTTTAENFTWELIPNSKTLEEIIIFNDVKKLFGSVRLQSKLDSEM